MKLSVFVPLLLVSFVVDGEPVRIEGGNGQIAVTRDGETAVTTYEEQEAPRVIIHEVRSNPVTYTSTLPRQWPDRWVSWIERLSHAQARFGHLYANGYQWKRWDRPSHLCREHHRLSW